MTVEHIWPKGFVRRTNYGMRYSGRAAKSFSGDLTIKDVCARCNGGPLSKLDDYACHLYDKFFARFVQPSEEVRFIYDHAKLLKWLLKVAYNSARSVKVDEQILARYAPVITAEHACSPINVIALVGTIKPAFVASRKTQKFTMLNPEGVRCARVVIQGIEHGPWCSLRMILINSFMFHLVIMREPTVAVEQGMRLLRFLYGVPLLSTGDMVIPKPGLSTMDAMSGVEKWPPLKPN